MNVSLAYWVDELLRVELVGLYLMWQQLADAVQDEGTDAQHAVSLVRVDQTAHDAAHRHATRRCKHVHNTLLHAQPQHAAAHRYAAWVRCQLTWPLLSPRCAWTWCVCEYVCVL